MSDSKTGPARSKLSRCVGALLWTALVVAVVGYPAAFALDRFAGRDVVPLQTVADAATVTDNRTQFDDTEKDPAKRREGTIAIYGTTSNTDVERILFVDDADVIRPAEDPSLALLPLAKKDGGHRLQAKSAFFVARILALGGGAAFVVLLVLRRFIR
jgi:hypothetical protein